MDPWLSHLLTVIAGLFGGFGGAYMAKKGEHRAIKEDIKTLVEQGKAMTHATEEIKAVILTKAWARDVRKETSFEVLKSLATVDARVTKLMALSRSEQALFGQTGESRAALAEFSASYEEFVRARSLASVVCGKEVRDAFIVLQTTIMAGASTAAAGEFQHGLKVMTELASQITLIGELIRKDLGIEV